MTEFLGLDAREKEIWALVFESLSSWWWESNCVFRYHLNLFSLLLIAVSYAYEKYLIRVLRIMGVSWCVSLLGYSS